jgi:hypothetical protein
LWALDSVLLLVSGWIEPTVLGEMFVLGQALIVAVLAELEFLGLRRSTLVEAHARRTDPSSGAQFASFRAPNLRAAQAPAQSTTEGP